MFFQDTVRHYTAAFSQILYTAFACAVSPTPCWSRRLKFRGIVLTICENAIAQAGVFFCCLQRKRPRKPANSPASLALLTLLPLLSALLLAVESSWFRMKWSALSAHQDSCILHGWPAACSRFLAL